MTADSVLPENAAEDLEGKTLPGGWRVLEKLPRGPKDTGGNFSVAYLVEDNTGRRGFWKVLNYWWLLRAASLGLDPVEQMANATAIYQFERDLARECVGLSRIVTAWDDGSVMLDGYQQGLVSFIIFEMAETDIRRLLNVQSHLDIVVRLRALHHLASGIRQLHTREVAHQDVKPSNTVVFPPSLGGARVTKLADLGRATRRDRNAAHDNLDIAGDPSYAPPEQLYGAVPTEFGARRFACDLYQLGSMVAFVFTSTTLNGLLTTQLHPSHHWVNWSGTYEEVLPYVRDAFGRALDIIERSCLDEIAADVRKMVEQLCDPEPALRGHAVDRRLRGNQYRLDRIVTQLDLLTRRAAIGLARQR